MKRVLPNGKVEFTRAFYVVFCLSALLLAVCIGALAVRLVSG